MFFDRRTIGIGQKFAANIRAAVASCVVVLVVIGRGWLATVNVGGRRRRDDGDDFVRLEIETAIKNDVRLIPVLVGGGQMPPPKRLPRRLRKLAERNALELGDATFEADLQPFFTRYAPLLKPRASRHGSGPASVEVKAREPRSLTLWVHLGDERHIVEVQVARTWDTVKVDVVVVRRERRALELERPVDFVLDGAPARLACDTSWHGQKLVSATLLVDGVALYSQ